MEIIGSKAKVKELMPLLPQSYSRASVLKFINEVQLNILSKKIRFPVLEYLAIELYKNVPEEFQLKTTDAIINTGTIGGNVIAGIILQLRLETHFKESISKASEYIILSNKWYACDIIGERVMGHALLIQPIKTISILKKFTKHPDKWIVRSVGVAIHYAVKKGLKKTYSEQVFRLLLNCSETTDFHTKKGIGWAAKTIAKFHPDIIQKYSVKIEENPVVKQWFKTKIKIGLTRSYKYASKYPG